MPTAPTCSAAGGCSLSGWPRHEPVMLAFEDLQWADSGLLDFIDYLLEWSAEYPIFVLALGRPSCAERRRAGSRIVARNRSSAERSRRSSTGSRPACPRSCDARSSAAPRGSRSTRWRRSACCRTAACWSQEGARYVVTGDVSDLEVPETLQALVASRLDGLSAERAIAAPGRVGARAVVHRRRRGGARAAGRGRGREMLDGLVAKQVSARDDDPRSPERGQYVFLQALLRTVAYGTLSRRPARRGTSPRRAHLRETWPGEARDIAEVLASHYLEAIRAEPDAEMLGAAGLSAARRSTAAGRAAALAGARARGGPLLRAGGGARRGRPRARDAVRAGGPRAARSGDRAGGRASGCGHALELHDRGGTSLGGAAAIALAKIFRLQGRIDEVRELLERFRPPDAPGVDPVTRAEALAELGISEFYAGRGGEAAQLIEEALSVLEDEQAWAPLASALITRAVYLIMSHRNQEGYGVLHHALALAERHDLPRIALRARFNIAAIAIEEGRLATRSKRSRQRSCSPASAETGNLSVSCWASRSRRWCCSAAGARPTR